MHGGVELLRIRGVVVAVVFSRISHIHMYVYIYIYIYTHTHAHEESRIS